ncbi:hypothetical protein H0H92_007606, partial [Tricholoma furcatifolium]
MTVASSTKSGRVSTIHLRHSQAVPVAEESSDPIHGEDIFVDGPFEGPDASVTDVSDVSGIVVKRRERYPNSDNPLATWSHEYRDKYLDAQLESEGRGRFLQCVKCGVDNPSYRCLDCLSRRMICKSCLIDAHRDNPLHCIQHWNDEHFHRTTFADLNVRIQIGHGGQSCGAPRAAHKDFVVIHTNGIHPMLVDFCGCNPHYEDYQQLLDIAWFPATPKAPRTCATYSVLRQFHTLNLQGQVTGFDFYRALGRLTDGTGLNKVYDRLDSFMTMVRQWRHLKMVKRSGRGHDPDGISGTREGELALPCRACPHPDINLPTDWQQAPRSRSWLYELVLSQDANFRLKNRLRSSDEKDPSLVPGWAYFVSSDAYLKHLASSLDQDEISHCVGFAALWLANTRKSKGLRATGVGSVSCARHQLFRATGTGDLQKGERYGNMDYILFSTLQLVILVKILICYDIACQYGRHFWKRMEDLPERMQIMHQPVVRFKVPKFHLPPHKAECHGPFSLNFTPGVGRTDGEGVERNWAWLNGAVSSTSQMGPGSRHDTLNDFMGFWNYRQTINFKNSLLRALVEAISEWIVHCRAFTILTEALQKEHASDVQEWNEWIIEWERDSSSKNDPYLVKEDSVTINEIRRELAEEEHNCVKMGIGSGHGVSPANFILLGLEIEDL